MSGFLYYLPTKHTVALADVRAAGLSYAFPKSVVGRGCRGPDGGEGAVCGPTEVGLGYYADRQTWRKIPGSEAWVGYVTAEPPGPDDLAREEQLGGHWVKLADGREWLCPVARGCSDNDGSAAGYIALPCVLSLADDGRWTAGDVDAKYRSLWKLAETFWDAFSGAAVGSEGNDIAFDFQGLPDAAVACLAANYRVGRTEAALLGLFDHRGDKAQVVLQAIIDWPSWLAVVKKKAAAVGLRGAAGQSAVTPDTVRA